MTITCRARRAGLASLAAGALVAVSLTVVASPALAASVTPVGDSGNPTCADLFPGSSEAKIDRAPVTGDTVGPATVTAVRGNVFDFTSTDTVLGVIVKGGTGSAYHAYDYRPGGTYADTDLTTRFGQGISHVSFCWVPFVPTGTLDVSKTAAGTYDRTVDWSLTKDVNGLASVTYTGAPGDSFSPTWNVVATKTDQGESNYRVAGVITVANNTNMRATLDVTDALDDAVATPAVVDCDPTSAGAQSTGIVLAVGQSVQCSYTATPADRTATLNTVTVTTTATVPAGRTSFSGFGTDGVKTATAGVSFTERLIGSDTALLTDALLAYSATIGTTTELHESRTYTCPTDRARYDSARKYTETITNTADLTPTGGTTLTRSATVTLDCTYPERWVGETATGAGVDFTKNENWFMFTPKAALQPGVVNLIAGQHHDAGDITLAGNQLTITLHDGFRFAAVANNVKINPLSSCAADQKYVSPGQYSIKTTASGSSVTVTVPTGDATCAYAIHVDVERRVS